MDDEPLLSVVVPTYQRRASLLRLLDALRKQTLPADLFEVVIAIDGSDDGTREAVDEFVASFALRPISCPHRGRAAARNGGAAAAQGELLLFLDDDMEPAPELLASHARAHKCSARVGVLGAAPVHLDAGTSPFARFMGTRFNDVLGEMATRPQGIGFAEAYIGNFSVRRSDFVGLGGLDDSAFEGYGLEDYEFALRLTQAGGRLVLASDALARQHYDKTFAVAARESESRGRSVVAFGMLHPAQAAAPDGLRHPRCPSLARRLFRFAAPRATPVVPIARRLVVWSVGIAERFGSRRLAFVYELGLEYFYLLGAREAARDRKATTRGGRR